MKLAEGAAHLTAQDTEVNRAWSCGHCLESRHCPKIQVRAHVRNEQVSRFHWINQPRLIQYLGIGTVSMTLWMTATYSFNFALF